MFSYATKKNTWAANVAIVWAWLMGLVIAVPAHIQNPGFRWCFNFSLIIRLLHQLVDLLTILATGRSL